MVRDYTTVNVPHHLAERIRKILEKSGHQSVAEFVRDAARRRLEEFEEGGLHDSATPRR